MKEISCPICNSKKLNQLSLAHVYWDFYSRHYLSTHFPNLELEYYKCNKCGITFNSLYSYDELKELYKEKYRKKMSLFRKIKFLIPYSPHYSLEFNYLKLLLKKIKKENNNKIRVLDVGCSEGKFLYMLKWQGCNVYGIEPTEHYTKFSRNFLGLNIFTGCLEEYHTEKPFDLITTLYMLEHVKNPLESMKRINSLLKKGGYLFFTVPMWVSCYGPEHLYLFSKESINYLLNKANFSPEKIEIKFRNDRCKVYLWVIARKK